VPYETQNGVPNVSFVPAQFVGILDYRDGRVLSTGSVQAHVTNFFYDTSYLWSRHYSFSFVLLPYSCDLGKRSALYIYNVVLLGGKRICI
jgi:hypothetical protein